MPRELEEAALLDGASRWTTFPRILLPLARPALLGDERAYTLPVVLNGYVGELGAQWGSFAAGVQGPTAGSVKG